MTRCTSQEAKLTRTPKEKGVYGFSDRGIFTCHKSKMKQVIDDAKKYSLGEETNHAELSSVDDFEREVY